MRKVIYPGSFDPVTYGHLDVIKRSLNVFDKVIVAVFHNLQKKQLFTMNEREKFLEETTADYDNIEVDSFSGLTVDYAMKKGAIAIIRGLRAVSDFEGEFQMASLNKQLEEKIETVFFMTDNRYAYLSSSIVKEVAEFNGDVSQLVPPVVEKALLKKFKK